MGTRHSRETILDAAVTVLAARGLAGLSFASVGAALGIPDRTVVYYFPTKADLLKASVHAASASLRDILLAEFDGRSIAPDPLLTRAWAVMTSEAALPWMRVYLELVGRAAAGEEVSRALAAAITAGWIDWLAEVVEGESAVARRVEAARIVAAIDGRLILATLGIDADQT